MKTRKNLPLWFADAWDQAVRDTEPGKEPAVVLVHAKGSGHKAKRWAIVDFDEWVRLLSHADDTRRSIDGAIAGIEGPAGD